MGPLAGIIENEFTLIGNKADTRNEIGIEDKALYTLDMDDMETNKFFYLGHRQKFVKLIPLKIGIVFMNYEKLLNQTLSVNYIRIVE